MDRSAGDQVTAGRVGWAVAGAAVLLVVGVGLLAPGTLEEKLAAVLRGVCAQRPDHAVGFSSGPVVLEARMLGIFLGFAVTLAVAWATGGARRSELPRGRLGLLLLAAVGALALDGANAVLFDLRGPYLYAPRNDLRLATGLVGGLGVAGFVVPMVAFVFWHERDLRPLFAGGRDLILPLAILSLAGVAIASGLLTGIVLGIVAATSVLVSLWLVSTYVAVLAWAGPGQVASVAALGGYVAAGFGLTLVELAAFAALRGWMESALGLTWVV